MLRMCDGNVGDAGALDKAHWIDLLDPTEDEIGQVEDRFDLSVPSRESLAEIELSSRLRIDKKRLIMSAPLISRDGDRHVLSPVGFILTQDVLVTVRFAEAGAFDAVHETIVKDGKDVPSPEIMVRLLEELVDRAADQLERVAEDITKASHEIFREPEKDSPRHRLGHETRRLRALMIRIGHNNEQMVKVRHSFLAIGRIATFVVDRCELELGDGIKERLIAVRKDIDSLDEFENSLSGRVQFLLDAATGFISIEQNDVVKVLTVVSVAGVPPVLVAGVYGMNFHDMPELAWPWGYPFAMALMVLTTILPILWFKWRDWL
jgi:magnesium transporter